MHETMARFGVTMIALSKDTPAIAAKFEASGLSHVKLLCDPDLEVIDAFGLVHSAGFEFATIEVGGLPLGVPKGHRKMAIPTTLLVDETGVVRWIDQADDYRLRGDAARIEAALSECFDSQVPETQSGT